jgi:hypothetical protein
VQLRWLRLKELGLGAAPAVDDERSSSGHLLYWLAVHRWACLWFACLLAAGLAEAQDDSARPVFPPDYPYLMRMEKQADNTDTCVLLKKDGSYHYERNHHDEHVSVSEGELTRDALNRMVVLLQRPDLVNLKQNDIPVRMFFFGDQIQLNIFRQDHWQDLIFPDAKDRKKLVPSVESLDDWLTALPKLQHREFTEFEARNNCLTEHKIELRTRPLPPPTVMPPKWLSVEAQAPPPPKPAPPPPTYTLWMTVTSFTNPMQQRCAVIYPDGRIHSERSSQEYNDQVISHVTEGTLPPPAFDSLRQLLDAPEWRVEYDEHLPAESQIRGGEIVHLQIPVPGGIYKSIFMNVDYQQFPDLSGAPTQTRDLASFPGSHLKLVMPLRAWFKQNVEEATLPPARNTAANLCKPEAEPAFPSFAP